MTRRVPASREIVVGGNTGSGASSTAATFDSRGVVSPGRIGENVTVYTPAGHPFSASAPDGRTMSMPAGSALTPIAISLGTSSSRCAKRTTVEVPSRSCPVIRIVSPSRAAGRPDGGTMLSIVGYGGRRLGTTTTPRSFPVTRSTGPRERIGRTFRVPLRASISTTETR